MSWHLIFRIRGDRPRASCRFQAGCSPKRRGLNLVDSLGLQLGSMQTRDRPVTSAASPWPHSPPLGRDERGQGDAAASQGRWATAMGFAVDGGRSPRLWKTRRTFAVSGRCAMTRQAHPVFHPGGCSRRPLLDAPSPRRHSLAQRASDAEARGHRVSGGGPSLACSGARPNESPATSM